MAQLLNRKWIGSELGNCEIIKQRLLNPEQDRVQLDKVYQEKNHLFTEESKKIRIKRVLAVGGVGDMKVITLVIFYSV